MEAQDYKNTLHLPETSFEMRAGLAAKEPQILAQWAEQELYSAILKARSSSPRFVLHDGPPYANGHIHQGHILNKILKDIIVKDRTMAGFLAEYVPGWDCHGLPIEVQVDKELGKNKEGMSKVDIRKECRAYANKFVDIQRNQFKRLGVFAHWDQPYLTMNFGYEATTLRELARFVDHKLVYKGLKPVNWCCVHQTALAEAEVEYEDHTSPSAYVAFKLTPNALFDETDIVIWTTTPWTLPGNVAVSLGAELVYVRYPIRGRYRIIAQERLEACLKTLGESVCDPTLITHVFKGKDLEHATYEHPFLPRLGKILLGDHVTLEAGTGCVHTAPAHGADDFAVCKLYDVELVSAVDAKGVLNQEAGPFAGLQVWQANAEILSFLHEQQCLLSKPTDTIQHRYAHCWRCHKPIILRATEQWFVAMDKPYLNGATLRERALEAVHEHVRWYPKWGEDRISAMLTTRPDWCLSRQRTWGVPIAVIYCDACETPLLSGDFMRTVANVFESHGADAWYSKSIEELAGAQTCANCGHHSFRKEQDILDVWFDSGVSYAAVIERLKIGHEQFPLSDVYLEGSDQHRGWFHSSLLCSLGTRGIAPFKSVLTHGFLVDEKGNKISKSKGNFVDPFKTIDQDGAEILRLWIASEEYRADISISPQILKRVSEQYRKIRNTIRFLLGNLTHFNFEKDFVVFEELEPLDQYMLGELVHVTRKVRQSFEEYSFHTAVHTLTEFFGVQLSAFYLDVLKDRLYASPAKSRLRRSAQTVIYCIVRDCLRLLAPVLAFTAEEAWGALHKLSSDASSVHLSLYPQMQDPPFLSKLYTDAESGHAALCVVFEQVEILRRETNLVLEQARRDKQIGSSTEAEVLLPNTNLVQTVMSFFGIERLAELLIVSGLRVDSSSDTIRTQRATGSKCARCWLYRTDVGSDVNHSTVCTRCVEALQC